MFSRCFSELQNNNKIYNKAKYLRHVNSNDLALFCKYEIGL